MGVKTDISWASSTFNCWWICTEVTPGCDNCYAREFAKRLGYGWGKGVPRKTFGDAHWNEPLRWNKLAKNSGKPWRVFCGSMCDVMDDEAPEGERERLWRLIDATPHLTWLLLTKRPHRYERYLPGAFEHSNVWLGTTTENQDFYDIRWPILRDVSYKCGLVAWISYEPALGPLTMRDLQFDYGLPNWIIFGGESGPNRRPMDPLWARNVLQGCQDTGVSFFMKQFSARTPKQGAELIPANLLVRQFPA